VIRKRKRGWRPKKITIRLKRQQMRPMLPHTPHNERRAPTAEERQTVCPVPRNTYKERIEIASRLVGCPLDENASLPARRCGRETFVFFLWRPPESHYRFFVRDAVLWPPFFHSTASLKFQRRRQKKK
jgi:hypothetical protein